MEVDNGVAPSTISPSTPAITNDEGGKCGWCCWRPTFLQRLSTSKSFLFWICWAGGFQSFLINGLLNVCVSTIERRYELTSTDSGIVIGCFDIASFFAVLPVSYLGGRKGACKPRWVGYGVLLLGLGSFVFASPHFLSGLYQVAVQEQKTDTCSLTSASFNTSCSASGEIDGFAKRSGGLPIQNFKYIFFLAQLLMGAGGAPLYTLGMSFIDENVSHKMQPVYSGVFFGSTLLGPALGYITGGQLLRLYVDFNVISAKDAGIGPDSSVWVGAWWLGFVIAGILLCMASVPLLAFPSELPGAKALAAAKEAEESMNDVGHSKADPITEDEEDYNNDNIPKAQDEKVSVSQSLRELPTAIKDLATRWTFLFICLEQSCEAMLLAGFGAFVPKIIESQFSVSPATAAVIVGALVIPCGCGGSSLGGYLIKHFRMKPPGILKLSILWIGLSLISSLGFMVYCPNQDYAGVTIPYSGKNELKVVSDCNSNCACSMENYDPVCGVDNVLYYSACHAGCMSTHQMPTNGSKPLTVYSDCLCISSVNANKMDVIGGQQVQVMAARKACATPQCTYQLYLFTAMFFLFLGLVFLNSMPILSATLRSVPFNRRSFALGTQMIIWRLLGAIPGPVIFGYFIDKSCLLWSQGNDHCNSGSDGGSCLVYDNYSFSRGMLGIAMVVKGLTLAFTVLAYWFYEPPKTTATKVNDNSVVSTNQEAKDIYAYDNSTVDRS